MANAEFWTDSADRNREETKDGSDRENDKDDSVSGGRKDGY